MITSTRCDHCGWEQACTREEFERSDRTCWVCGYPLDYREDCVVVVARQHRRRARPRTQAPSQAAGRPEGQVSWQDLARMHEAVKHYCFVRAQGPRTEAFRLMCSLGALMGYWPRSPQARLEQARARFVALLPGEI